MIWEIIHSQLVSAPGPGLLQHRLGFSTTAFPVHTSVHDACASDLPGIHEAGERGKKGFCKKRINVRKLSHIHTVNKDEINMSGTSTSEEYLEFILNSPGSQFQAEWLQDYLLPARPRSLILKLRTSKTGHLSKPFLKYVRFKKKKKM